MSKGIRKNRFLLFVGLQWNQIDDTGAKALGRSLTRNTALKGMFLMGNPITKTGAQILVEGMYMYIHSHWLCQLMTEL